MYKLLITLFALLTVRAYAQTDSVFRREGLNTSRFMVGLPFIENGRHSLSINGNIGLQGNAVNGLGLKDIFLNSYLSDNDKADIDAKLRTNNFEYYDQTIGINYYKQATSKWIEGYGFQALANTTANTEFSRNAFILATSGNGAFEGSTANFNNLHVTYAKTFSAGGTVVFKLFSGKVRIGVSGEAIGASTGINLNVKRGSLYTAPYGQYINTVLQGDLYTNDTSATNEKDMNGYGFKLGGFIEYRLHTNNIFTVSVQNLGCIYWNSSSYHFSSDTAIHFDGYSANSLFDPSQSGLSFNADTISKIFHIKSKQSRYVQNLLPLIAFQYMRLIPRLHTLIAFNATTHDDILNSSSLKLFAQYQFRNNWAIGPSVSYYSGRFFGAGIIAGKSWKRLHLFLSSEDLLFYLRINHMANENIRARVSFTF